MQVLAVDTSKTFLSALRFSISQICEGDIKDFDDHSAAISHAGEHEFQLIIVGSSIPQEVGIGSIRQLRAQTHHREVPIIFMCSRGERSTRTEARTAGATDFLLKPTGMVELQARVSNLLALTKVRDELADNKKALVEANRKTELIEAYVLQFARKSEMRDREPFWCLAQAMAAKDGNTGNHVERVGSIAQLIAIGIGLDSATCSNIAFAAPFHDIGKIGIPDSILKKPGQLTADEMAIMSTHVSIGLGILEKSCTELARVATTIVAGHHERWDGGGYPSGLAGDAIPIEARIVAVADVFDALCSARPYKVAWPIERAFQEIIACSGTHFDPACVDAFRRRWPSIRALFDRTESNLRIEPACDDGEKLSICPPEILTRKSLQSATATRDLTESRVTASF